MSAHSTSRRSVSLLAAVAAFGLLAATTACSSTKTTASDGSEISLIQPGKLTTCTHLPYAPFQFKEGNEIVGFDVDLVDAVADEMGVEQRIVDTPFEGIQSGQALNAGKCDVAAAGMTITETREKNLDFSDPYFEATQALMVKKENGYDSLEALEGKKLGVQQATTGAKYAQDNGDGVTVVEFEDIALLLTAVKTGQVDAAIHDNGALYDYVQDNPKTKVTTEFDTGEQYGIGVKTGNDALRKQVDKVIAQVKSDGTYDEIYKKWFGKAPESGQ